MGVVIIIIIIIIIINNLPFFFLAHPQPRDFPRSVSMMMIGTKKEPIIRLIIMIRTTTITVINGAMIMTSIKMDPTRLVLVTVATVAFSPHCGHSLARLLFARCR